MLKLKIYCNGVHFKTHFSLDSKHLLQYSSSSTLEKSRSSVVDFLVKSLGFSRQEAITTWSKVRSSKIMVSNQNPNLVVDFFKNRGFSNAQIKKMISSMPKLLKCNVEKTLVPKFNVLEELGISGKDLCHIIASNNSVLRRGVTTRIAPMISCIKSIMGDNEKFIGVLRRSYWLMSSDVVTRIQPNIDLFKNYGFSNERIVSLLKHNGELFGHNPKKLEECLIKVEKDFQIPVKSSVFANAVVLLASLSEETRESKYKVFKNFGWTDLDILTMVRKSPKCLTVSEENIRARLDFFMKEMGCEPSYLAKRSYVLTYSMKARVLPRYTLLKVLKEKKLINNEVGILTAVCSSEPVFLKRFVLPYKDDLPGLCEAYISREIKTNDRMMRS